MARAPQNGLDELGLKELIDLQERVKVAIVEGSPRNLKITTPEDMILAEHLFQVEVGGGKPPAMRVGIGYDIHRLVEGRQLFLGGLELESTLGLLGHSDGDSLCHAICDALLGAAGLGDIGSHFPDNDPKFAGIGGLELLRRLRSEEMSPPVIVLGEETDVRAAVDAMREGAADFIEKQHMDVAIPRRVAYLLDRTH